MSSIASFRTPSPELPRYSDNKTFGSSELARAGVDSQQAHSQDVMTPPPSTQIPKLHERSSMLAMNNHHPQPPASPPPTIQTGPPITSIGLYGEVPSLESVGDMKEPQLRRLTVELLSSLGEARVTVAHAKLQHNLLAMEKEEAAERAEVEHEATRREVQALQENSPLQRPGFSPHSPHASLQQSLQLALAHCREVQEEKTLLERRLRASKKLIADLDAENLDLKDRNHHLRQRIKANRDHLNEMQSNGAISIYGTPMTDFGTPLMRSTPRTPASGRPSRDLDTLLMAGQLLSGESTSVPSTPTPAKPRTLHTQHVRGAHSLSSLPATPNRARLVTHEQEHPIALETPSRYHQVSYSTPSTQAIQEESQREREERDSTISVSDHEGGPDEEQEMTGSQASQRATTMLRRSLGGKKSSSAAPGANTSKQIQTKLVGQVRKPGATRETAPTKRPLDDAGKGSSPRSNKKAKLTSPANRVGLGIQSWQQ